MSTFILFSPPLFFVCLFGEEEAGGMMSGRLLGSMCPTRVSKSPSMKLSSEFVIH